MIEFIYAERMILQSSQSSITSGRFLVGKEREREREREGGREGGRGGDI
jgi:hypothetical protein